MDKRTMISLLGIGLTALGGWLTGKASELELEKFVTEKIATMAVSEDEDENKDEE